MAGALPQKAGYVPESLRAGSGRSSAGKGVITTEVSLGMSPDRLTQQPRHVPAGLLFASALPLPFSEDGNLFIDGGAAERLTHIVVTTLYRLVVRVTIATSGGSLVYACSAAEPTFMREACFCYLADSTCIAAPFAERASHPVQCALDLKAADQAWRAPTRGSLHLTSTGTQDPTRCCVHGLRPTPQQPALIGAPCAGGRLSSGPPGSSTNRRRGRFPPTLLL